MMDQLVVPLLLPRLQVDANQRLAEQVVPVTMAAKIIARWRFDRQISEVQLGIDTRLRPHTGVAGVLGRPVLPGVVPLLALFRNRMENPHPLSGADVEAA